MKRFITVLGALLAGAFLAKGADSSPPYAPRVGHGYLGKIERLDPALDELLETDAKIEVLAEGFLWAEGPVWSMRGNCLLFSDVPKNVIWRWREFEGLTEHIKPSGGTGFGDGNSDQGSNGLTLDNEGHLLVCQHGHRQVARTKRRGTGGFEPIATNYQGKRFNSPNDLALKSNGDLYFTDPPYGLPQGADDPRRELKVQGVYRVSYRGRITLLVTNLTRPNGIAFSPDERRLYVGVSDPERAQIMAYDVADDGTLRDGKVLFDATRWVKERKGLPDGLKVDVKGNVWATGPGGVLVLTPEGNHLGTINPGVPVANCAWGGDGSVLYLTAERYLCRVQTRTRGPMPGPMAERR